MEDLKGSWAVVTGAGRGIGRSIALKLAGQGISVIGVARTESDLTSLEKAILELGAHFIKIRLDLSKPDSAELLSQKISELNLDNPIRVLCLNAAINATGPFDQIPIEAHEHLVNLNVMFPMKLIHLMLPALKKSKSSYIVAVSSQGALLPNPWMASYAASKSFLHHLSLALSYEFKRYGIHVITAIPSHTETSAFEGIGIPSDIKQRFPHGRPPEEIAEAIIKGLRKPSSPIVTNVKGLFFLRAFIGLAPISFVIRSSGRMFSALSNKSFFAKALRQK